MMRRSSRAAASGAALTDALRAPGAWAQRLCWEGRHAWRHVRYQRRGGIGMLAGGALCLLAAVVAREQAHTRLHLLRLHQATEATAPSAADGRKRALEALVALERAMPEEEASAPVLQALLQLAVARDLEVPGGNYLRQHNVAGGFVQWHINLPVQGAADQVDDFLQAALLAYPALALTRLEMTVFKPESGGRPALVQARPEWVLHTRMATRGRTP